jgi:AcrR family transcriptional regulator
MAIRVEKAPDALDQAQDSEGAPPVSSKRDTRAAVLAVASELFAERGYAAATVREVVARAGCTKPTLYYYFASKEELFLEVLREATGTFTRMVEAELARPGTVRERFCAALSASVEFLMRHPTTHSLLMTAEKYPDHDQPDFDFESVRREHLETCAALLREGRASGEVRSDLDVDEAALAIFGMVDHRLALAMQGRPLPARYVDMVIDLFFLGAQTR